MKTINDLDELDIKQCNNSFENIEGEIVDSDFLDKTFDKNDEKWEHYENNPFFDDLDLDIIDEKRYFFQEKEEALISTTKDKDSATKTKTKTVTNLIVKKKRKFSSLLKSTKN